MGGFLPEIFALTREATSALYHIFVGLPFCPLHRRGVSDLGWSLLFDTVACVYLARIFAFLKYVFGSPRADSGVARTLEKKIQSEPPRTCKLAVCSCCAALAVVTVSVSNLRWLHYFSAQKVSKVSLYSVASTTLVGILLFCLLVRTTAVTWLKMD